MKIQYLSDLHLEFGNKIKGIEECDSDILIIAGDLSIHNNVIGKLYEIGKIIDKPIIFVPGNHEYYNIYKKVQDFHFEMNTGYLEQKYIYILNNNTIVLDDVVFIGSTGWWDRIFDPELKKYLNDFNLIGDINNLENNGGISWGIESKKFFESELEKYQGRKIVCVSHNCPTLETPLEYIGSKLNVFFNNDWSDLIEKYKPNYWIYGHTHTVMDYKYSYTQLLCNPMGYPHEKNNFEICKTLKI